MYCITISFKGAVFSCYLREIEKDESGYRSLGQVANEKPMTPEEWEKHSIMDPVEFNTFFKDDFTKLAGLVAEGIYHGRFNYKASKGAFRQMN